MPAPAPSQTFKVTSEDLNAASQAGLITAAQVQPLAEFLSSRQTMDISPERRRFDVTHLLWYAGALIVMSAMGLFSTLAFTQMGGAALAATAIIYAACFGMTGHYLWHKPKLQTPGGLLIAVAVSMAPLAVYGIQDALGLWSAYGKPGTVREFYIWIKGSWIFMELATIAAAALALRFYKFPFIVLIAAIALWFLSMDIVPWITGSKRNDWETSRIVSIWFGAAMLIVALFTDLRQRRGDFAFWLYLFGLLAFWGGITSASSSTDLSRALYCAMNVGLLMIAAVLARPVFAVFGTMGIALYLGHLAEKTFADSLLFPFALSLIGIAVIGLGLWVNRHRTAINHWIEPRLPDTLRNLRARRNSFG